MGTVFLAERAGGEVTQRVAIKLPSFTHETATFRERFQQERQIMAIESYEQLLRKLMLGNPTRTGTCATPCAFCAPAPLSRTFSGKQGVMRMQAVSKPNGQICGSIGMAVFPMLNFFFANRRA
jgi:hypothetical protein